MGIRFDLALGYLYLVPRYLSVYDLSIIIIAMQPYKSRNFDNNHQLVHIIHPSRTRVSIISRQNANARKKCNLCNEL